MQKKQWLGLVVGLALVQALTWKALAQEPFSPAAKGSGVTSSASRNSMKSGKGAGSFQSRMERAVGLSPEQKEAVRGLLAQQSQDLRGLRESIEPKVAAVQEQTDAKIRALLNAEQLKKFDAFLTKQKQAKAARSRRSS